MNGEVFSKIVLMTLFIAEVYLSHQNGKDSGAASKSLSTRLHLSEKILRTGAHIGFFAVMMFLACWGCKVYRLRMMVAPVSVVIWSVMDEVTKPPYSVTEIVETFERVNDIKVNHVYGPRRAGDLAELYANADKALKILGWKTEKTLEDMCRDSWNWQKQNPNGYNK